ncbi:nitrate reductase molybdenum cofactor assembly chaperone [Pantoea sp. Acro-805]|jgi:nitrate reductase molybdenum cofactor assembly chaperone NarJ/NarW|uniref:Nitrate reductase molybdenum cofactor assembly chaperone n=1 Tax=Candidatus Pantoea formicae TaxID=2608355 RepID=A0ABX0QVK3_9GAMM|nr:nitrate reductase molybdenum cofactor assembly chaperone [Pantoea formicae]NIF00361.1 nitrate reductase molybdenum cofactor assembly chaperone [Pantoea formicae]
MEILKLIGMLIEYPDDALWQHQDEIRSLAEQQQPALLPFINQYLTTPPLDMQADWCALFERGRATSLLLFEHVHAESRDRGQAMVDLLAQYEQAGLQLNCRELPDYLPLYLEYLSLREASEARQGLLDIAPILALLGGRLKERESAFSELFDALLTIANSPLRSQSVAQQVATEARDDTREALDAVWEEEQVKFIDDKTCDNSAQQQHQRRFRDEAAPQYLDLSAGGSR